MPYTPKTILRDCLRCSKPFPAPVREVNRGNGKYCSQSCAGRRPPQKKDPTCKCALCDREFYRTPSKEKNSRSGLAFCCRAHKDAAQRIGGIEAIQPDHYNGGRSNYREIAFRTYGTRCMGCGYNRIRSVVEVHHLDGDRENNKIGNLCVLCPTCHTERHYFIRLGAMSLTDPISQLRKIRIVVVPDA